MCQHGPDPYSTASNPHLRALAAKSASRCALGARVLHNIIGFARRERRARRSIRSSVPRSSLVLCFASPPDDAPFVERPQSRFSGNSQTEKRSGRPRAPERPLRVRGACKRAGRESNGQKIDYRNLAWRQGEAAQVCNSSSSSSGALML